MVNEINDGRSRLVLLRVETLYEYADTGGGGVRIRVSPGNTGLCSLCMLRQKDRSTCFNLKLFV